MVREVDHDLIWQSATELRAAIGDGALSPVDLVEACLARIDQLEPQLHAFVHVDREGARAAARAAELAVARGDALGPLHGIPVAVKDDVWVAGMPATCGSLIFARFVPGSDGTVAARLRRAGAIIIGKTNLPEFTSWPRSISYVGGETRNPWDPARIPGASSGGSAAAVAAGMVPLAIGTDGGGSVRIPAALCGLVGLLPTIGRVPDHGGFLCSPMSTCGPMARSVGDAALLQGVIAGPDPAVANSLMGEPPALRGVLDQGVRGLKVAWSADYGLFDPQPGVLAATRQALDALAHAGAAITPMDRTIPHPWGDGAMMADVYAAAALWSDPDPEAFPPSPETDFAEAAIARTTTDGSGYFSVPEVRDLFAANMHLLTPQQKIMAANMRRDAPQPAPELLCAIMDEIFERHDVLCSPTMAWIAPTIPAGWAAPYPDDFSGTNFTFIANATGRPAVSVPCGLSEGMPVGFQIIGRAGDEQTVLRAARAIEAALPPLAWPA